MGSAFCLIKIKTSYVISCKTVNIKIQEKGTLEESTKTTQN